MLISSLTIVSSLIGKNTGKVNYRIITFFKSDKKFEFYPMSDVSNQHIILQNQVHLFMEP